MNSPSSRRDAEPGGSKREAGSREESQEDMTLKGVGGMWETCAPSIHICTYSRLLFSLRLCLGLGLIEKVSKENKYFGGNEVEGSKQ